MHFGDWILSPSFHLIYDLESSWSFLWHGWHPAMVPHHVEVHQQRHFHAQMSGGNFSQQSPRHLCIFSAENPTELHARGAALSEYILSNQTFWILVLKSLASFIWVIWKHDFNCKNVCRRKNAAKIHRRIRVRTVTHKHSFLSCPLLTDIKSLCADIQTASVTEIYLWKEKLQNGTKLDNETKASNFYTKINVLLGNWLYWRVTAN